MLSFKTCIELANTIDNIVSRDVDRIYTVFDLEHLIHPTLGRFTNDQKINIILKQLKYPPSKGPFTDSFRIDMLQYIVDRFYRYEDEARNSTYITYNPNFVEYQDRFSDKYKQLTNCLKRDGFVVKERSIKKLLPEEMQEAKTESELYTLLVKFDFIIAKGHLEQATQNHSQSNWAGANSQFRTFIESLLIETCRKVLPNNSCDSAASAIKLLGQTANPAFLKSDLNEIENSNCKKPFVEGLWKRLHPEGSHPGLSDEEDSTFRYHLAIVFGHYLLKRLEKLVK